MLCTCGATAITIVPEDNSCPLYLCEACEIYHERTKYLQHRAQKAEKERKMLCKCGRASKVSITFSSGASYHLCSSCRAIYDQYWEGIKQSYQWKALQFFLDNGPSLKPKVKSELSRMKETPPQLVASSQTSRPEMEVFTELRARAQELLLDPKMEAAISLAPAPNMAKALLATNAAYTELESLIATKWGTAAVFGAISQLCAREVPDNKIHPADTGFFAVWTALDKHNRTKHMENLATTCRRLLPALYWGRYCA